MWVFSTSLMWGQVNSLANRFALETGGRKTLCMVPCNSRYIYGTWESKKVRGSHKGWGAVFMGQELTPLDTIYLVYSNYTYTYSVISASLTSAAS